MKVFRYALASTLLGFLAVAVGVSSVRFLYNAWLHAGF